MEQKQPPQYGAQSPPPPTVHQTYNSSSTPGQTYSPPSPFAKLDESHSNQLLQPSQIQHAQHAPQHVQYLQSREQEHYAQYPPQIQYHQAPQQAYYQFPQQFQQQQHPVQESQVAIPLVSLTSSPAPVQCPNCGQRAMTMITFVAGNTTHGWAIGLCGLFCLGCIPYLISDVKDVEHRCSKCGIHLATWHRSGRTEPKM